MQLLLFLLVITYAVVATAPAPDAYGYAYAYADVAMNYLGRNSLTGSLPSEIGLLENLKTIVLGKLFCWWRLIQNHSSFYINAPCSS